MKVKSESEFAQSCPTLQDPMDCSPPGSSVHGIFQAKVLEWGVIAFSQQRPREVQNDISTELDPGPLHFNKPITLRVGFYRLTVLEDPKNFKRKMWMECKDF